MPCFQRGGVCAYMASLGPQSQSALSVLRGASFGTIGQAQCLTYFGYYIEECSAHFRLPQNADYSSTLAYNSPCVVCCAALCCPRKIGNFHAIPTVTGPGKTASPVRDVLNIASVRIQRVETIICDRVSRAQKSGNPSILKWFPLGLTEPWGGFLPSSRCYVPLQCISPAGRGVKSVTRTPRNEGAWWWHDGAFAGAPTTHFPPAPMHLFCSAAAAAPPGNHRPFSRHTASGHSGHKPEYADHHHLCAPDPAFLIIDSAQPPEKNIPVSCGTADEQLSDPSSSVAAAAPRANFSTLPCAHYPSASSQQSPNIAAMPSKPNSQRDSESEVRSWGFPHVFTWTDGPNAHYSPHSHRGLTTHLILRGNLTITYPKDKNPDKVTYGVGDRIDVDAGRVHEVWIGDEGYNGCSANSTWCVIVKHDKLFPGMQSLSRLTSLPHSLLWSFPPKSRYPSIDIKRKLGRFDFEKPLRDAFIDVLFVKSGRKCVLKRIQCAPQPSCPNPLEQDQEASSVKELTSTSSGNDFETWRNPLPVRHGLEDRPDSFRSMAIKTFRKAMEPAQPPWPRGSFVYLHACENGSYCRASVSASSTRPPKEAMISEARYVTKRLGNNTIDYTPLENTWLVSMEACLFFARSPASLIDDKLKPIEAISPHLQAFCERLAARNSSVYLHLMVSFPAVGSSVCDSNCLAPGMGLDDGS
ncbi:uncharacterized protein CLUP02_08657 [Colletotrichum lupini]|uniref:Cupin domain-containing protein n=1 Tax=Colletotrichum lupini TaxID=145971 RepID=A0A9Q8STY1_9PEZI|nr:uncharacterized protein CLUP02_08657 [Colletotrichum lupini]UQC83163.1 hypothetical protein CLUP02_08657 [Colletotrichum lupini]